MTQKSTMHAGIIIRGIRQALGRTLEEVAFDAGTDASNLSRIERGQQRYSTEVLERIATALGLTMSALYARMEDDSARPPAPCPKPKRAKLPPNEVLQSNFDKLNPAHQALALDFLQLLLRTQGTKRTDKT
jgi:transcriptional regulator with XRE-family HTH domain